MSPIRQTSLGYFVSLQQGSLMQQSSQGLRALSRRWQAAIEATNDPELRRHFAGHVDYLTTLADRLELTETNTGEAGDEPLKRRDDRRGVVLVLEDDDTCRHMARNILRKAGFEVVCASNFSEAVYCVEDGGQIDVALVDVKLPAGSPHGISFARMAQRRSPSLKVVFMSGQLSDDLRLIDEDEAFLCKPFAPDQLLDVVTHAAA
jgi:CheY-like chemotaxis protein